LLLVVCIVVLILVLLLVFLSRYNLFKALYSFVIPFIFYVRVQSEGTEQLYETDAAYSGESSAVT
jgi:hypothetical protein